jgi:hypothetical protein
MDLTRYVDDLHRQLAVAAEAGGEEARALAQRLTAPLEAAARLVLLEALSDAANEITAELAPGSVDVRLRGRDPEFVVTALAATTFQPASDRSMPSAEAPAAAPVADDASTSRTTLRLPDQLKVQVEQAAARDGVSVNTWLVRAIAAAVEPAPTRPTETRPADGDANRVTGWVR